VRVSRWNFGSSADRVHQVGVNDWGRNLEKRRPWDKDREARKWLMTMAAHARNPTLVSLVSKRQPGQSAAPLTAAEKSLQRGSPRLVFRFERYVRGWAPPHVTQFLKRCPDSQAAAPVRSPDATPKPDAHNPRAHGTPTRSGGFYATAEWKRLRYLVLKERGARCECCGATPADGATMRVDHIKPVSRAWDRRLDPTNLQVLCNDCNWGKGGWDETDWRGRGRVPSPDEDPQW
jgi:5-methylcytosine-specific restriction endonuclease McrA